MLKPTIIRGKKPGPTSIILAGVHGNERCGIEAVQNILPNLQIERGTVFFAYGNPRAIEQNKRYTEANLNRMFQDGANLSESERNSYEYQRAQFLKKYLDKADALLDIHASFTENSQPFVICEANARGIVEYLPVNTIVSGFDAVEPGGTDYYMNRIGRVGICVECGFLGDPAATSVASQSILFFLQARGHLLANSAQTRKQSHIHIYNLYIARTNTFTLRRTFSDFEELSKGEVIGIDGRQTIYAEKPSVILFARNTSRVGEEAFLLGKKKNSLA